MKKLGLVLVVLAAITLVAPVMAADKAAAPAAEKAAKADKAGEKAAVKAKAKKEPVTVTGMVSEVKNKKGKVIGVAIQGADNAVYTVVKKGKGTDITKMVGKKIEAKGTVAEKKGKKYIYVKEYKEAM